MNKLIHPVMTPISIDKLTAIRTVDALPFIKTISGSLIDETKEKLETGCVQTRRIGAYNLCVKVYPPAGKNEYDFKKSTVSGMGTEKVMINDLYGLTISVLNKSCEKAT